MSKSMKLWCIDKLVITQSDDNTAIADWLIELLLCRDGMLHLSGNDFDADDLLSMINLYVLKNLFDFVYLIIL